MSGKSSVRQADLIYGYDGTLAGFYSCVFESFVRREIPFAIWAPEDEQPALCPVRQIPTDPDRAARVRRAVRSKTENCDTDQTDRSASLYNNSAVES